MTLRHLLLFSSFAWLFFGATGAAGVSLKKFSSCESCQAAGYGWSDRRMECGGYLRKKCPDSPNEQEDDDDDDDGEEPDEVWKAESKKDKKPKKKKSDGSAPKKSTKLVKQNFARKVQPSTRGPPYWVVAFLDGSELSGDFESGLWRELRKRDFAAPVHFGTVNATSNLHIAAKYGIPEFPGVAAFGKDKPGADTYGASLVHAEVAGLRNWVNSVLPKLEPGGGEKEEGSGPGQPPATEAEDEEL